jgi:hypothetical protein
MEGETHITTTDIGTIKIDLVVGDELATLGFARDFERSIQDYRKKQGYKAGQTVRLSLKIDEVKDQNIFEKTMAIVDWSKLCVEVKWYSNFEPSDKPIKTIVVKDFVSMSVE